MPVAFAAATVWMQTWMAFVMTLTNVLEPTTSAVFAMVEAFCQALATATAMCWTIAVFVGVMEPAAFVIDPVGCYFSKWLVDCKSQRRYSVVFGG